MKVGDSVKFWFRAQASRSHDDHGLPAVVDAISGDGELVDVTVWPGTARAYVVKSAVVAAIAAPGCVTPTHVRAASYSRGTEHPAEARARLGKGA